MKLSLRFAVPAAMLAVFVAFYLLGPIVPIVVMVALFTYAYVPIGRARWIPAAAFVFMVLTPGLALAASIDIGQALNGSLQDVINGIVTAAITAVVGWLAYLAKSKFNIDIEARHREALTAFLQRQASSLVAKGAVKLEGVKIEVQNQQLADAANQALAMIPGALAFFGLSPTKLQGMIVDLIPKQPAVAAAQAVAMDVANPATPSKPA
jgi:hypothetical protein